jgi:hypothetical protein
VRARYFSEYPCNDISLTVVSLTDQEEKILREYTKLWNSPYLGRDEMKRFGEILERHTSTPFGTMFGRLVMAYPAPDKDLQSLQCRYASIILDHCPEGGRTTIYALAVLLRHESERDFRKTLVGRKGIFQNKYVRFNLREVLWTNKKSNLYDEVMKDVANNR